MEIWKDIEGYEGLYEVSNLGNVKSLPKEWVSSTGLKKHKEKILKCTVSVYGYSVVGLYKGKKMKQHRISRLVAAAFLLNMENKAEVNHIDGCKANNYVDNLEWITSSENIRHADRTGLRKMPSGENHHKAKLNESDIINIRREYKQGGYTHKALGEKYNVHQSAISQIIRRERWKHILKLP